MEGRRVAMAPNVFGKTEGFLIFGSLCIYVKLGSNYLPEAKLKKIIGGGGMLPGNNGFPKV